MKGKALESDLLCYWISKKILKPKTFNVDWRFSFNHFGQFQKN